MERGRQTRWGSQDPRKNMMLSFIFALYFPGLELKELKSWIYKWVMTKKQFPKRMFSVTKRPGKGKPSKEKKILDDNHSTLTKYHRKISGPLTSHTSQVQMSNLSFNMMLQYSWLGGIRKGQIRSHNFHSDQPVASPHPWASVQSTWETWIFTPTRQWRIFSYPHWSGGQRRPSEDSGFLPPSSTISHPPIVSAKAGWGTAMRHSHASQQGS